MLPVCLHLCGQSMQYLCLEIWIGKMGVNFLKKKAEIILKENCISYARGSYKQNYGKSRIRFPLLMTKFNEAGIIEQEKMNWINERVICVASLHSSKMHLGFFFRSTLNSGLQPKVFLFSSKAIFFLLLLQFAFCINVMCETLN